MTDAGPSSMPPSPPAPPAPPDPPAPPVPPVAPARPSGQAQPWWTTAALVAGALLIGVGAGWTVRGGGNDTARPAPPAVTVSASPEPPVTVSAEPPPPVTVTASPEPVAPATVTVTVSPSLPSILTETVATPDCLRALELADQGFGLAQKGFGASKDLVDTVTDAISAVRRGNFGAAAEAATALEAGTAELTTVTDDLNRLTSPYNSARDACINR